MQELVIDRIEKKIPRAGGNPFYVIHGESGEEATSFDGAFENFGKGTKLNVELKVKGKHINIDSYEVLSATVEKPTVNGGGYKKDIEGLKVEYQLKARLQAIDRASIEAQTAYNGAIKLLASGECPDVAKDLVSSALAWGKSKLHASKEAPSKQAEEIRVAQEDDLFSVAVAEPIPQAEEEKQGFIDMDWLKESQKILKWTDKTMATWLVSKYKVKGGLLEEVIAQLTKEQQKEFVQEIQDRREMS